MKRVIMMEVDIPYQPRSDEATMKITIESIDNALKRIKGIKAKTLPMTYENYARIKRLMEG